MITIAKVKQAAAEFIKILRFGKDDVQTANQISSYGIDSKPKAEDTAVYASTSESGESVILGYVYTSDITREGEIRIYSDNIYLHLKDGIAEFNGNSDNLIRYIPINSAMTKLSTDINIELTKIAAVLNSIIPGSYTLIPISIDISTAKIDEIYTN